jgi:hypothetical protein
MNQASVEVVGRAGLAGDRPVQAAGRAPRCRARPTPRRSDVRMEGGVGARARRSRAATLLDHVAVAVGDALDQERLHAQALVGEGGEAAVISVSVASPAPIAIGR